MTTTAPQDTAPKGALEEGRVVAIAGPVIDVEFPPHALPEINYAVEFDVELDGETNTIAAEVAQQIGEGRVRCICMQQTDGLVRGAAVRNLGHGITVPVGNAVLGHVFNVLGQPLDTDTIGKPDDYWEIHRRRAGLRPARAAVADVRDRHQGHRPARALRAGRQDRPLRRCGRRQDRHHPGDDQPGRPAVTAASRSSPAWESGPARAPTCGSRCRSPASSTRRRSSTARWTSRRACACASAWPRSPWRSTSAT